MLQIFYFLLFAIHSPNTESGLYYIDSNDKPTYLLLLLDINGAQMAKGGFYCEAAGNAAYFTPLS